MLRILPLFLLISNVIFAQVNLNMGLMAYYPFSGNANDISGNNNNPVFNNAILTSDRFGNANSAYLFNGTSSYMQVPNSPSINSASQVSICAWVKVNGFYQGTCHGNSIVMKGDADFIPGNYALRFDDNPYTNAQNCSNPIVDVSHQNFYGVNLMATPPGYTPYIQPGTWYSVVYTSDGITSKLYVNCELKISAPANGFTFTNSYDLFLGKMNDASYPYWFNGVMDEVRIYNRALNIDEVRVYGGCSTFTGPNIGGTINTYTPVLALNPCDNRITVENAATFNTGDTVLLIQMKGAIIDSTNTAAFGTITDYKNAGNYEFNYVKSNAGNIIELKNKLTRQYNIPAGKVQLIRVPYYVNANVTSTLTCLPWDGSKGGVLVVNVQDTISLNAGVNVSSKGFIGGQVMNLGNNTFYCHENNYYYPNNLIQAAPKGEGITTLSVLRLYGKGSLANGGGGGLEHNSGGAGGGNAGTGGKGGKEWITCGPPIDNGGIGGISLLYNNTSNKVFLGGGGGAGHCDNPPRFNPNGASGGGIVIIQANFIKANTNTINADGGAAIECVRDAQPYKCHEGMGGGGAGGSVLLNVNNYLDNIGISIKGGKGADMNGEIQGQLGPGGGGSGGITWFSNASLPLPVTVTKNGGLNGINIDFGNDSYGATPGTDGINLFNLAIPVDNILFKPNIDSVRIKDSATACSSFDFKGFGYTNTNPISGWQWYFGDGNTSNTQNTSHTYSSIGTYTVKLVVTDINGCKDSVSKNVTATNALNFDFTYQQNTCNPLSVQFAGIGADNQNPFWSFGDAATVTGISNPVHVYAATGNYIVKYSVSNGVCTDTITKTITLSIINEDIILTRDTTICSGTTKQLLTVPSLGFCWSPITYLNNPNSPNPITSTPQNITYYFTADITGNNIITNGNFNNGNTGFTSQYIYANPNTTEGQYFVGTNPQAWNASLSNCPDHTGGNGNMMLVNGSPIPDVKVWGQTVTVTPNTNYAFSTWIQALWPPNPAQLQFSINGRDIGILITASLPTCTWTQFYTSWNSGNNSTANISIVNKNTQIQGNDFALDDISFAPLLVKRDSVKITVETAVVTATNSTGICNGVPIQLNALGAATYSWTPVTGLNNSNIANPVASPTTTTQYIVTGTTANGCLAKDTVDITVLPKPVITKSNDATICTGGSTQLLANGGVTYSWSPAATLNNASIPNPVATPAATTNYIVVVTGANTCRNTDSIKVTVRSTTGFAINPPVNVCKNNTIQLNASGGDLYAWQPAGSLSNPAISNPNASPSTTTPYTVQITDTLCGNTGSLSTIVTVLPLPIVRAAKSNDIDCSRSQSQLSATGAAQYSWSPTVSLINPNSANPIASPFITTLYTVNGTDFFGCTNNDTITVKVTATNNGGYLMPTAFTPNNDGRNDCYGIKYWGTILELDFSIYNRWGERVFHTTNPSDCWNGVFKGIPQVPAVFVYMIRAKTSCQASVFRKGTFALIR